jgi:hypothetical protein
MSTTQLAPRLNIPSQDTPQATAMQPFNPRESISAQVVQAAAAEGDFTKLPKNPTLRDRLKLSTPAAAHRGQIRTSTTPSEISLSAVLLILSEGIRGLQNLDSHVPGLEKLARQMMDIKVMKKRVLINFNRTHFFPGNETLKNFLILLSIKLHHHQRHLREVWEICHPPSFNIRFYVLQMKLSP